MKKLLTIFLGILIAPSLSPEEKNRIAYRNEFGEHTLHVTFPVDEAKCTFSSEDKKENAHYPWKIQEILGDPDVNLCDTEVILEGCPLGQILQCMKLEDRNSYFTIDFNKPGLPEIVLTDFKPEANMSILFFERLCEFIETTGMEFNEIHPSGKYIRQYDMENHLFYLFNELMDHQASAHSLSLYNYPEKHLTAAVKFCADTKILSMRFHNFKGIEFFVRIEIKDNTDLLVELLELLGSEYSMRMDEQVLEVSVGTIVKYLSFNNGIIIAKKVRLIGVRPEGVKSAHTFIKNLCKCGDKVHEILSSELPLKKKRTDARAAIGLKIGFYRFGLTILDSPEFTSEI